jgi:hypothetical protein
MKSMWDNLLVRFSVVSLAVLAAFAVSIAVFVSDRIRNDAIDEVIEHAVFDTHVMALGAMEPADFEGPMTGERFDEFDLWMQSTLLTGITAMVNVWSANGTLVYSSGPRDVERDPFHEQHLPKALSGEVAAYIRPADDSSSSGPRAYDCRPSAIMGRI